MNPVNLPFISENISLKDRNTFRIDIKTRYWAEISQPEQMTDLMETEIYQGYNHYLLGGGSNILFADDYQGLIIKVSIPGIEVLAENDNTVEIRAGAGVSWDELVGHCISRNWGGIENLTMIPGLTGAAPIQNIGAYGSEIKDTFVQLDALNLLTGEMESFDKRMCRFGYRDSIFKQTHKGRYLITHVVLRLNKKPQANTDYGSIRQVLHDWGVTRPAISDVSRAVRHIRSSRLPNPQVTGNAGSFFKNPVIPASRFEALLEKWPDMPHYPANPPDEKSGTRAESQNGGRQDENKALEWVKIPAAWLIEQCGFKGSRNGDAGVHKEHALILVNHGNASGKEILSLAETIKTGVHGRFGIRLEPEVNIIE